MTFLAPVALALGLAVAVPLTLHLLSRHQAPRIPFPAVRYLRRAEREHATRLRLRQVLLLALRMLAILLLATAAARPFLPAAGRDHPPTSVVMVLDNSLASGAVVGDRRVLDALRDAALESLSRAGPEDRIWLVRAGQPWEPAFHGEREVVAEAVRATAPSAGDADLPAAVERAASILAGEAAGRPVEIHVLSHLARASLGAAAVAGQIPVLVLDPALRPNRNRAVTAVEVGGGLPPRAGESSVVTARIEGFGDGAGEADSVAVRLVVGGTVRAVAQAAAGDAATLPLPAMAGGLVMGRVEIDADALAQDDRRHFVAEVRPPPVTHLSFPVPFLEEALGVLDGAGRVREGSAAEAQVVIAPGAAGSDAVRRGAAVVVLPPTSPVELAATNQRLAAAGIPWRYSPPAGGEARLDAAGSGLEGVLEEVRLRQVFGLEGAGEARDTVILRVATGEAWAVGGRGAAGRYILLATPFTVEGGTLPTSAAMIPLLDRVINAWALGGETTRDHEPGAVVTLPEGDSMLRPDGTASPISPGSIFRLAEPGIYQVLAGDSVVGAFAVNPTRAASDTRPVDAATAARALGGDQGRSVSARTWGDAVFRTRLGTDVGVWLVVLALLALLAESGVAAAGRGRRPSPVEHLEPGAAPDAAPEVTA
jgi:hypothetical protein